MAFGSAIGPVHPSTIRHVCRNTAADRASDPKIINRGWPSPARLDSHGRLERKGGERTRPLHEGPCPLSRQVLLGTLWVDGPSLRTHRSGLIIPPHHHDLDPDIPIHVGMAGVGAREVA